MCIRVANARRYNSVPPTIAAELFELGVRQLAARIPYEGVLQRDAVRTLRH
jgi:hypothetical protein